MTNFITTGDLAVTPSEATELCVHHLRLAFIFFLASEGRAIEENRENLMAEVKRQVVARGAGPWELDTITAFVNTAVNGDEGPDDEPFTVGVSDDQTKS
jgi:hypothetical protein